jgi:outer membrane protein OmpA-like peptidoglycan-associated protein
MTVQVLVNCQLNLKRMNRKNQEIQGTLDQLAKILLDEEEAQQRDNPSQTRKAKVETKTQESEQVTASKTPQSSGSTQQQGDHCVYNQSSAEEAQKIQNYLDELGKLLNNSSNPDRESTTNPEASSGDLSPEKIESGFKEEDSELRPKRRSASDSVGQESESSQVIQTKPESSEVKEVETAGILEELLEQFRLDPNHPKAINYEELLQQLAIDQTDPTTVKDLDQLLERLTDQYFEDHDQPSIAKPLDRDDRLDESADPVMQPTTQLDPPPAPLLSPSRPPLSPSRPPLEGGGQRNNLLLSGGGQRNNFLLSGGVKGINVLLERKERDRETEQDVFSPLLSDIGETDFQRISKKTMKRGQILAFSLVTIALILVPWGIYQYFKSTEHQIEQKVTKVLKSSPDIAFYNVEADVKGNILSLSGKLPSQHLRDRAQTIAELAAPNLVLDNNIIVVDKPADMVQVAAEVQQVVKILNQIDGINISAQFERGNVVLEGTSIQEITIKNISKIFADIPGIRQVDNQIQIQPISIATRIYFNQNSSQIVEGDFLSKISQVKELIEQYPTLNLKIIGYTHETEKDNQSLALKRSQAVENYLEDRGIDRRRIQTVGEEGAPPDISSNQERWLSRCVVFEIIQSDRNPER